MMLPLVPAVSAAISLAQFAPQLLRWLGASDSSVSVAEKAVEIAKTVTGAETSVGAEALLTANPELALKFRLEVMQNERAFEEMYFKDMQDARARDVAIRSTSRWGITRADLLAVAVMLGALWIVYMVWKSPELAEFQKGVVTLVIGRLLGYVDQVFAFEFGTTRRSKENQDLVATIIKGK